MSFNGRVGRTILLLVLGGLAAPAAVLAVVARLRRRRTTWVASERDALAEADARDLVRMDSDKG